MFLSMILSGVLQTALAAKAPASVPALSGEAAMVLPGAAGSFDFMETDSGMNRILAAHRGTKTLEVLDLKSGAILKSVPVGAAQGVAVDLAGQRYFVGNEADQSVVIVDAKTLAKVAEVKVDGPVDAITYDSDTGMVYAGKDDGNKLWVVNTKTAKMVGEVSIPGVPEVLEYDPITKKIYLNIKDKDLVVRIDPATNKVDATWSTLPATSPHGLAVDRRRGRVYVAGGKGKLVALDLKTGAVQSSVDIANSTDQMVYDAGKDFIYSAGREMISITKATDKGVEKMNEVPSPKGAHTLAFDPLTHDVWVCYADKEHSYLKKFKFSLK